METKKDTKELFNYWLSVCNYYGLMPITEEKKKPKYLISKETKDKVKCGMSPKDYEKMKEYFWDMHYSNMFQGCTSIDFKTILK